MEPKILALTLLDLAAVLAVIFHILRYKREPVAAALWIFIVITFPFLGLALYLVFGINLVDRRVLRKVRAAVRLREEHRRGKWQEEIRASFHAEDRYRNLVRSHTLLANLHQRPLVLGNRLELLVGGSLTYREIFRACRAAQSSIHCEVYILADDEFGWELARLLAARRQAGLEVRVLYDALGSIGISDRFVDYLTDAGVAIAPFGHLNPVKRGFQINLRNHRKNLIIDGKIGFTGGINLHAENSKKYCRLPRDCQERLIHDYHFQVQGPVVSQLQEVFAEDWYAMTGEMLTDRKYFPAPECVDETVARVITSGPGDDEGVIAKTFFAALTSAREEVLMVTPYFYPDPALLSAIKSAALSGVKVTLILPRRSDHRAVGWAAESLFAELLAAGVRLHLRKPPFIHSKAMIIDRARALVGSANLDYRSLRLNYELNLEVIGGEFVARLDQQLRHELGQSQRIEAADLRRWHPARMLRNNLCALFAPVL